jgi:hypothetical protein
VVVWTNAGRGRFVARETPAPRHLRHFRHGRLVERSVAIEDDLSGDATQLFVLPAVVGGAQAAASEPLTAIGRLPAQGLRHSRRSPRGPPSPFERS